MPSTTVPSLFDRKTIIGVARHLGVADSVAGNGIARGQQSVQAFRYRQAIGMSLRAQGLEPRHQALTLGEFDREYAAGRKNLGWFRRRAASMGVMMRGVPLAEGRFLLNLTQEGPGSVAGPGGTLPPNSGSLDGSLNAQQLPVSGNAPTTQRLQVLLPTLVDAERAAWAGEALGRAHGELGDEEQFRACRDAVEAGVIAQQATPESGHAIMRAFDGAYHQTVRTMALEASRNQGALAHPAQGSVYLSQQGLQQGFPGGMGPSAQAFDFYGTPAHPSLVSWAVAPAPVQSQSFHSWGQSPQQWSPRHVLPVPGPVLNRQ